MTAVNGRGAASPPILNGLAARNFAGGGESIRSQDMVQAGMTRPISVRGLTAMELQRAHDPLRSALVVSPRAESVLALTMQSPISVRGLTAMELQRAHTPCVVRS
jgi:hypothetical protein